MKILIGKTLNISGDVRKRSRLKLHRERYAKTLNFCLQNKNGPSITPFIICKGYVHIILIQPLDSEIIRIKYFSFLIASMALATITGKSLFNDFLC